MTSNAMVTYRRTRSIPSFRSQAIAILLPVTASAAGATPGYRAESRSALSQPMVETDQQKALAIRAQWMRRMGLSEEEIQEACQSDTAADLDEEMENLRAAEQLAQVTPPRQVLEQWATKY